MYSAYGRKAGAARQEVFDAAIALSENDWVTGAASTHVALGPCSQIDHTVDTTDMTIPISALGWLASYTCLLIRAVV